MPTLDYGNNIRQSRPRRRAGKRLRLPGLCARLYPPAVLPRRRPVPLGGPVGRPRRYLQNRCQGERTPVQRTSICTTGSTWRASASPSRACPRVSAGSVWETATSWASPLTKWSHRRAKSAVVIGRDHLDSGSVASPNRETEAMSDGSDAVSDWPLLNALVNTASGATWVSLHHGGGVGMGFSQHSGMVICCDGTADADRRIARVFVERPGDGRDAPRGCGLR